MKKFVALFMSLVMVLSFSACAQQDATLDRSEAVDTPTTEGETYNFVYAADCAEDTVQGLMINYFAEQLNERSGGRITVQLHFSGSMGSDVECFESCQNGDITFYNSAVSTSSNFIDEVTAIDLPFLYDGVEVFRKVMDDEAVNAFFAEAYENNSLHLLGFYDQGMRQLTSNKEVKTAEDLNGLKIRVMDNAFHVSIWKALGANPTPMAMSEVYIGLQQGTIDAQENGVEVVYANRVYEQQKYMVMTNHLPSAMVLLMNSEVYDSLSDSDKELVDAVGRDAVLYARQVCDERQDGRKQLMEETGIQFVELTSAVQQELQEKCETVYSDVRATYGDEVVDMLLDAVAKY